MFKRNLNDIVIVLIGVATTIILIAIVVWLSLYIINPNNCTTSTYECRKIQLQLCIKDEQYTLDQCLSLVGSNNK